MEAKPSVSYREIKFLIIVIFALLTLMGYFPNRFNFRLKKFFFSPWLMLYTICVVAAFAFVYLGEIRRAYLNNKIDLKNAAQTYYYMNILMGVLNLIAVLAVNKRDVKFFNNVPLFETLNYFKLSSDMVKGSVFLVGLKTIIFPLILEVGFILKQRREEPESNLLWGLYKLYPVLVSNMITNCFFGAVNITEKILNTLNGQLEKIVSEVNFLQKKEQIERQKPYYRMRKFCEIADLLDVIKSKYSSVCLESSTYLKLVSAPFICSMICNLFGITAGFYMQYTAIADALINNEAYDAFQALTNSIFLILSFSEIALVAIICNKAWDEAAATGYILQKLSLVNADIRFQQSVESFSLVVLTTQYKVKPLGLMEINVSMIHDVASTVTSFLLILIQTDLALRFSMK